MNIERRATKGLTVRSSEDKQFIGVLTGYAARFNSDSVPFDGGSKGWVERIAPGAFKRTLTENSDVVTLWSHRSDMPVARTPETLTLAEDANGLAVEIKLVDTATNRDLLTNIRSGIVNAMSFGFVPVKTEWRNGDQADVRTLIDVNLMEVSPVVWPAYPATSIGARSALHDNELRSVIEERDAFFRSTQAAVITTPERDIWAARLGLL